MHSLYAYCFSLLGSCLFSIDMEIIQYISSFLMNYFVFLFTCFSPLFTCFSPLFTCFSALTDCQSCVVQSHNVTSPTYPLLRHLEPCAWCIHERTCQPLSSMTGSCQQPPAEPVGWWMGGVTEAHNQSACVSVDNWPAGFRYAVYRTPVDYSLADKV